MDDYPVKVGRMLFTMVDPHRRHEVAYHRWYEGDFSWGARQVRWLDPAGCWDAFRDYAKGPASHLDVVDDAAVALGEVLGERLPRLVHVVVSVEDREIAAGRRSYGQANEFTEDGRLVASFVQDGMIRHLPDG